MTYPSFIEGPKDVFDDLYDESVERVTIKCQELLQKTPFTWQAHASATILSGVDCLVVAPTGGGKSLPIILPMLLKQQGFALVLSPLNALQISQANAFNKMGLKAVAVNGQTASTSIFARIKAGGYQVVLTSPEMILSNEGWAQVLGDNKSMGLIEYLVVDEVHCISTWGADFRPDYGRVSAIRSFLNRKLPVLALSATLTADVRADVRRHLGFKERRTMFINLGNNRPNICWEAVQMTGKKNDLSSDLAFMIPQDLGQDAVLEKGIVFAQSLDQCERLFYTFLDMIPNHLHPQVECYHSLRGEETKARILTEYMKAESKIKAVFASEALAMGLDMDGVKYVGNYGCPSSLSVWVQRAGRAGRSTEDQVRARLIVERSVYEGGELLASEGEGVADANLDPGDEPPVDPYTDAEPAEPRTHEVALHAALHSEQTRNATDTTQEPDAKKESKKVEKDLLLFIREPVCRRALLDRVYSNPAREDQDNESGYLCCDRCARNDVEMELANETLVNGTNLDPESISNSDDSDSEPEEPSSAALFQRRTNTFLQKARAKLWNWRHNTSQTDALANDLGEKFLLSDQHLRQIAARQGMTEIEDFDKKGSRSCGRKKKAKEEVKAEKKRPRLAEAPYNPALQQYGASHLSPSFDFDQSTIHSLFLYFSACIDTSPCRQHTNRNTTFYHDQLFRNE
ncbi:hypothetical protein FRC04_002016 [Tulasnella sp. 424]|nr:hypothetical protein FRC04_002016 [Tulasnella sp. 424]